MITNEPGWDPKYEVVSNGDGTFDVTYRERSNAPIQVIKKNLDPTNPNHKVLLIEAGSKDTNPWIHIPGGYFKTMLNPKTDWCFQTEKEEFCDNREMVYPRGKTLGGSSSINGMLYIRGQSNDFDYWRQLGNVGWSWDCLLYTSPSPRDQRGWG